MGFGVSSDCNELNSISRLEVHSDRSLVIQHFDPLSRERV